jgi:hypothetical protein
MDLYYAIILFLSINTIRFGYVHDTLGCPFVFVFTDETYINKIHASSKSYLSNTSQVSRGSSKGHRLIILHAITLDGPLCERINGIPVNDLS